MGACCKPCSRLTPVVPPTVVPPMGGPGTRLNLPFYSARPPACPISSSPLGGRPGRSGSLRSTDLQSLSLSRPHLAKMRRMPSIMATSASLRPKAKSCRARRGVSDLRPHQMAFRASRNLQIDWYLEVCFMFHLDWSTIPVHLDF